MNATPPLDESRLTYARPWKKSRAVVVVVFVGCMTLASLGSRTASHEPQADLVTAAMLTVMWALALWAVLGLRSRTMFDTAGVIDIDVIRTVSLRWDHVTHCTIVEKTLHARRGRPTHGVLIRFTGRRNEPGDRADGGPPRARAIELFVPDVAPLAPGIIALLRTIPQVSKAPWDLLDPDLRRRA